MPGVFDSCATCGAKLVHPSGRGKARKYCDSECQSTAAAQRSTRRVLPTCRVSGCDLVVRSSGNGLCEAHYMRNRRHGNTDKKLNVLPGLLTHSHGFKPRDKFGPMSKHGQLNSA